MASNECHWDTFRDRTIDHYLEAYELRFIRRFVEPGAALVEIGCGPGRITSRLREMECRVIGMDINAQALALMKARSPAPLSLIRADAARIPLASAVTDYIVCIASIDYFDQPRFLAECHRLLRQNGLLIFSAVNRCNYKRTLKRLAGRAEPLGQHGNVSTKEMLQAVTNADLVIEAVEGYNWLPFNRRSNNPHIPALAGLERTLQLHHVTGLSPWILVAARKGVS